eukprot:CAMPEP_0180419174 /NCGR_PEP_ID=MMETSP1036_2-20121128/1951_1 /TAXON_ID=632150 /ORGANISM="Azadinium spinosum, Strain 3D9" /LENGTH=138 /DNA_ID=CAMNT_0022424303 /DNA_START=53 /DNA_END=470 /DNA_ORIENTATION=+
MASPPWQMRLASSRSHHPHHPASGSPPTDGHSKFRLRTAASEVLAAPPFGDFGNDGLTTAFAAGAAARNHLAAFTALAGKGAFTSFAALTVSSPVKVLAACSASPAGFLPGHDSVSTPPHCATLQGDRCDGPRDQHDH